MEIIWQTPSGHATFLVRYGWFLTVSTKQNWSTNGITAQMLKCKQWTTLCSHSCHYFYLWRGQPRRPALSTLYFGQMCVFSHVRWQSLPMTDIYNYILLTTILLPRCAATKSNYIYGMKQIRPNDAFTFCYEPNRFIIWKRMNCTVRWWRSDGRSITEDTSSAVLLSVQITIRWSQTLLQSFIIIIITRMRKFNMA